MATAVATATFTNADSQTFTWVPALTNSVPNIIGIGVIVGDSLGPVNVTFPTPPTNTGGTISASCRFTGTVTLMGSD